MPANPMHTPSCLACPLIRSFCLPPLLLPQDTGPLTSVPWPARPRCTSLCITPFFLACPLNRLLTPPSLAPHLLPDTGPLARTPTLYIALQDSILSHLKAPSALPPLSPHALPQTPPIFPLAPFTTHSPPDTGPLARTSTLYIALQDSILPRLCFEQVIGPLLSPCPFHPPYPPPPPIDTGPLARTPTLYIALQDSILPRLCFEVNFNSPLLSLLLSHALPLSPPDTGPLARTHTHALHRSAGLHLTSTTLIPSPLPLPLPHSPRHLLPDTGPLARTPTLYIALQDSILPRLRFPKFMAQTNELLGDEVGRSSGGGSSGGSTAACPACPAPLPAHTPRQAEAVVEALLGEHSRLSRPQLVKQSKFPQCVILPFLPAPPLPLPTHLPSGKAITSHPLFPWSIRPCHLSHPLPTHTTRQAEAVVEALLEHGRLSLHQLVQRSHCTSLDAPFTIHPFPFPLQHTPRQAEAVVEALLEHGRLFPCRISPPPLSPLFPSPLQHTPRQAEAVVEAAEAVVEALLEHGRLSLHQLVQRSVAKAGSSDPSAAKTEGQVRQQLVAALSVLIHERLVERVGAPEPMLPARGASSGGDAPKPAARARVRTRAMMESSGYFDSEEHRVVVAARCSDALRFQLPGAWVLSGGDGAGGGAAGSAAVDGSAGADGGLTAAAAAKLKVIIRIVVIVLALVLLVVLWMGAQGRMVEWQQQQQQNNEDEDEEQAGPSAKRPATGLAAGGGKCRGRGEASFSRQCYAAFSRGLVLTHLQRKRVVLDDDDEEEQAGPSAKRPATGLAPHRGKRVVLDADDEEEEQAGPSAKRQALAALHHTVFPISALAPHPTAPPLQRKRVVLDDDDEEEQAGPSAKRPALRKRVVLDDDDEEEQAGPSAKRPALRKRVVLDDDDEEEQVGPIAKRPALRKRVVLDDDDEEEQAGPSAKRPALRKRVVLDDDDEEEQAGPSAKRLATGAAPHNVSHFCLCTAPTTPHPTTPHPTAPHLQRKRVVLDDDDDEEQAGPSAKRPATGAAAGGGEKQGGGGEDSGVLWRVNYEEFLRRTRHQTIVDFVRESIDPGASIITAALLHAGKNQETSLRHPYSASLSLDSIVNAVRGTEDGRTMALDRIRAALQLLVAHPSAVASRSSDAHYTIQSAKIIELVKLREVEAIVSQRFGPSACRLFRLLLSKNCLEQKQAAELAMISLADARQLLYRMMLDEFVQLQEVPKTADHAPQRTFYLWRIHIGTVLPRVLNHMCHGACNLRLRLEHEMQQEQEVLSLLEQIEQAHAAPGGGGAGGAPEKAVALTSGQRKQLERIRRVAAVRSGVPFSGGAAAGERRAEEAAGEYSGVAVVLL
ncbi:unnamed protein product [Closterium sp. Naga37s-1]|nr:unnamed protein product [Closterium sp. Naga37s-1]